MSAALTAVAAILVGLPLLAWWLGGRRFWGRLRLGSRRDREGEVLHRHGLAGADAAVVMTAVNDGERLHTERLRRAAIDLATVQLAQYPRLGWRLSRLARIAVHTGLAAATAGLLALWLALNHGDWGSVPWVAFVYGPAVGAYLAHRRRILERAIRLNSDPPPEERPSTDVLGQ